MIRIRPRSSSLQGIPCPVLFSPHQARPARACQPHRRLADVPVQRRRRLRRPTGISAISACWRIPAPAWWSSRRRMWSGTAASPTAASGSIPITTRRRWRASSPIAGASAPPSSASSSRTPAARRRRSGHGRAAARCKPDQDPWQTIAPSAIPFGRDWHMPRAMTDRGHRPRARGLRQRGQARGAHRLRR